MFEELRRNLPDVEVEKIENGYLVSIPGRKKVHCKTFNGLIQALEEIFKDRYIYDKQYANVSRSKV